MSVLNRTIVGIEYRPQEQYYFDEDRDIVVLQLDDGTEIFAMQDEEGNGPGVLMHRSGLNDEYIE